MDNSKNLESECKVVTDTKKRTSYNATNMKKGKKRHKKEETGRNWVEEALGKNKEKSEKVLEEYMEWMKPGTWIATPGNEFNIEPAIYQLHEEDFPFYMDQGGRTLYFNIYTKGGKKQIYAGREKAKPDPTVRKKFSEWLSSSTKQS